MPDHHRFMLLALPLLLLFPLAAVAETLTFTASENDNRNSVTFESNAPLEKVVGRTHSLKASLTCDPTDLSKKISGRFEVDLSTLDTGLQLRNQHMRENHLETARFPSAVFTLTGLKAGDLTALPLDKTVSLMVEGELDLHGVKKSYRVPGELTYTQDGSSRILTGSARWGISLPDHDIHRPRYLFMKLAEEEIVTVRFVLTAGE